MHEQINKMVDLYQKGRSSRSIAEDIGVSACTVSRNLRKAGVVVAPRGQRFMLTSEYVDLARRLRAEGLRWTEISARIGFSVRQLQLYVNGK